VAEEIRLFCLSRGYDHPEQTIFQRDRFSAMSAYCAVMVAITVATNGENDAHVPAFPAFYSHAGSLKILLTWNNLTKNSGMIDKLSLSVSPADINR